MFNCLSEIKNFRANKLRPVQTKVVSPDGKLFVESRDRSGAIVAKEIMREQPVYVPDLTPDLTVAQIIPGLVLGSQDVAQDLNTMNKYYITHVLNLAAGVQNAFSDKFVYKSVNVLDEPDTIIRDIFRECFAFIDYARQCGTVLVHCNAGVSRAATIVIAYLMKTENLSFAKAMEMVSAKRAVKPNDGFMRQLKSYDEELEKLRSPQAPPPPREVASPIQRQDSTQTKPKVASSSPVQKQNSIPQAAAPPPPPPPPQSQPKVVPRQASITTQKSASPVQTPPKVSSPVPPKPASPVPPKTASPVPPKPASPVQQSIPPKSSSPVQKPVPKSSNVVQVTQPAKPSSPVQRQVAVQQQQGPGPRVRHIPIQLEADEESEEEESEEEESEEEEEQPQQRSSSKPGHYSQSVTVTIVSKKK